MILCITGDGKGKTTSAIGIAVRARGHGKSVAFLKFMKGIESGEDEPLRSLGVRVELFGSKSFINFKNPSEDDRARAMKGLEEVEASVEDVVVADEALTSATFGLVDWTAVEKVARPFMRSEKRHIVLTGRGISRELKEAADLVSDVKKAKHYFDEGFLSLEGLDL